MNVKMNGKILIPFIIFFVVLSGCISDQTIVKSNIKLTSSPSGAEIYLDSQFRGSTPSTITSVEQGNHTIEFRYPGYQSWSSVITVSPGTNNIYTALAPQVNNQQSQFPAGISPATTTPSQPTTTTVTIKAGKDTMLIGDSNIFSGTGVGTTSVLLTLYGPGKYTDGVSLGQQNVNELGEWGYTWNPGTSVLSGVFTMVVEDPKKTASDRVQFSVIGGGLVSIASNSYAALPGQTLRLSGQCTTGAHNVELVLYGPGQFAGGVTLGTFSVEADKTWNFKYTLDNTMTTGTYTIYVYDIPKTTSGNTQFTVGFATS
jgi:hypothetical protein